MSVHRLISNSPCSLVLRPHPLRGEGSGDIEEFSWSCTLSRDSIELNVLSHMNAELAQPRSRSNVTRPFTLLAEGGVWGRDYTTGGWGWYGVKSEEVGHDFHGMQ